MRCLLELYFVLYVSPSLDLAVLSTAAPSSILLPRLWSPQMSAQHVYTVLRPSVTFQVDTGLDGGWQSWRDTAQSLARLEPLNCTDDVIGTTATMVNEAAAGDRLAMGAIGAMHLLGHECARKRNITWGLHWLGRATELGQPDALALMGFLHASNALRDLYNFTDVTFDRGRAVGFFELAAAGGSEYASLALAYRHAFGVGQPEDCPAGGAMYERAALSAAASLDTRRRTSVEQTNPAEPDHAVLLSRAMPDRERVDKAAVEYMDYCAQVGDPAGRVGMGHLHHSGAHGVPQDHAAARLWFGLAARQGESMGHANLGMMEMRRRRYARSSGSLRRAARLNDPSGWAGLAYAYLHGAGVPQSDELAARSMWLAARDGHLDSMYNLGVLSLQGRGVPQSVQAAFRWWSVAAEFSQPQAQLQVGRMALRGLGVRKSCATAQFFLKHAAEAGPLVRSLLTRALAAYDARRPQRALMHFLLAAHAGVEAAQHNAGFLYAEEMPRLRPREAAYFAGRAVEYFKQASRQGSVEAQVQLGNLLAERSEYGLANAMFQQAAHAGSRDAIWHLGYHYWHGRGVEQSASTAWALFKSAGMHSRHARLRGTEAFTFSLARVAFEFRGALQH